MPRYTISKHINIQVQDVQDVRPLIPTLKSGRWVINEWKASAGGNHGGHNISSCRLSGS